MSSRRGDGARIGYTTCPETLKRGFVTRKDAKSAVRQTNSQGHFSQYVCDFCGYWHNGKLPSVVARGMTPRDSLQQVRRV